MFYNFLLILVLDKDNVDKHNMQLLNDHLLFIEGKKATQPYLALCEKVPL